MRMLLILVLWGGLTGCRDEDVPVERRLQVLQEENQRLRAHIEAQEVQLREYREREILTEAERDVAAIRDLPFLGPVQYRTMTREELPGYIRRLIESELPGNAFERVAAGWEALGLLPPGIDLEELYLDLMTEQVAAFYDPREHELWLFDEASLDNEMTKMILAHELTHALQDQHFHLKEWPLHLLENDDLLIGLSSLIEGDAVLVMEEYLVSRLSWRSLRDSLGGIFDDHAQLMAAPAILRQQLMFPYLQGAEFCRQLFARGGWEAINAAFADPPLSSSQILHVDQYLSEPRLNPLLVTWPDSVLDVDPPFHSGVLGEWGLRVWFQEHFPDIDASEAARGWRGERFLVYGADEPRSLLWLVAWSSEAQARTFAEWADQWLTQRYADGEEGRFFLVRSHSEPAMTVVMDAPDPERLRRLEELAGQTVLREAGGLDDVLEAVPETH